MLDLDTVAKRFGCDKQMTSAIHEREASLNQQLTAIKASYAKQIEEKKKEFGENPTPEQEKILAEINRQALVSLGKVQQQAKVNLNQHGSLLIQGFRRQLQPIAREVAREKGLSIIVTKNDSVIFDYDTGVDITEGVIAKLQILQEKHQQQSPAEAPAAEQPAETPETAARSVNRVQ